MLASRAHGERALIVQLLTREHGRHAGLLRGGQSPKTRAHWQIGNRLSVTWRARLAEHLGFLTGEVLDAHAARLLDDPLRLGRARRRGFASGIGAARARAASTRLSRAVASASRRWARTIAGRSPMSNGRSRCSKSSASVSISRLAPRPARPRISSMSRRARARQCRPRRARLIARSCCRCPVSCAAPRPRRRREPNPSRKPTHAARVLDGLQLVGFFLEQRVFAPHQAKLPAARSRYVDALTKVLAIPAS